jgi:hypothetical protein
MSAVNSEADHIHLSGWFMASLNAGLVFGLLLSGGLALILRAPASGILFFSLLAAVSAVCSFFIFESAPLNAAVIETNTVIRFLADYRWLWYSSIILIGITGVVTSLYPKFSGASPEILGLWMAGMSIATIAAVLTCSRTVLHPIPTIRLAALLIAAGVVASYWSAAGFLLLGALAGVVMMAQMAFLAGVREHQGVVMGLFSTTSYLGMSILPVAAGFIAEYIGFFAAFMFTALSAITVTVIIGRIPGTIGVDNRQ